MAAAGYYFLMGGKTPFLVVDLECLSLLRQTAMFQFGRSSTKCELLNVPEGNFWPRLEGSLLRY